MGKNKKDRTEAIKRRLNEVALLAYSKVQIEEYNFERLIRRGVIRIER